VALGTALEAAILVGVTLYHPDGERRSLEAGRLADRLALLPSAIRPARPVDDDF
jgi:hypothetical protein